MVFFKKFFGNCKFFSFGIQLVSIWKVAKSSDLSNQSDDDNEKSDDDELDNATREVDIEENKMFFVYQNYKMHFLYSHYGRKLIL